MDYEDTVKIDVYFIKSGDEIKIGRSKDVLRRLDELQTANSNVLRILYTIKNVPENFEEHVHSICSAFHIRGEWFEKGVLEHLLKHPFYKDAMKPYSVK